MATLPIPQTTLSPKVQRYADKISTAWQKAVDGILSVSHLLKDAEKELNSVEQMDLYGELPFSKSTADKLGESLNLFLEKNVPTNPSKWSYYKSQAKKKFDVYPSAYANAWAAKQYKAAGGGWKKG